MFVLKYEAEAEVKRPPPKPQELEVPIPVRPARRGSVFNVLSAHSAIIPVKEDFKEDHAIMEAGFVSEASSESNVVSASGESEEPTG